MKCKIEKITPAKATGWLKKNKSNRKLSASHVRRLAKMMTRDKWVENGDTISLNGEWLIDGQHRLSAVVLSGVSINAPVVRELSPRAYATKDRGKRRTTADTLLEKGHRYSILLAATCNKILGYAMADGYSVGLNTRDIAIVDEDYIDFIAVNSDILRIIGEVAKLQKDVSHWVPTSMISSWWFLFTKADVYKDDLFWIDLCTGSNLPRNSPRHALRKALINDASQIKRMTEGRRFYLGVIALQRGLTQSTITHIKFPDTPPIIKGIAKAGILKEFGLNG